MRPGGLNNAALRADRRLDEQLWPGCGAFRAEAAKDTILPKIKDPQ